MSSESTVRDGRKTRSEELKQQPDYQLIETMRWEPFSGILRLGLHLARLENSARTLGFHYDMDTIRQSLAETATGEDPLRLRLTLAPDGIVDITTASYPPLAPDSIWRIAIARTRLRHDDRLLRHKTTQRQAYIAAREEYAISEVDEVILLNERDEVCEGTITSVFVDMDHRGYITPALSCGLLDGVLRREFLNNNTAAEGIITLDDLHKARDILVGNSLRGTIRARLVSL
ncbi:hypothetical protein DKP76_11320 [Falsochrobactrum shanghaiense]|uniref:Probable branched-chain-amino-acid aminotransferase n=1 Tax=Falsochrobactrum shanghaiense TaxID=2201899 RepID=A0A316J623_9HYPH|nr:aminotransferase class IV family protein [Falsochrobactrum shanghaiense]PWL17362.1 hypothetical protein DKP76_11320 [Falsochrobactrum shanghaiense]